MIKYRLIKEQDSTGVWYKIQKEEWVYVSDTYTRDENECRKKLKSLITINKKEIEILEEIEA
jgi:hypothetical protein